ncbi:MAG: iron-sulfur cluster assembly protein [Williamsia herbipolensis]|nr:iron-sulfur cluster assembly protein [Williamsia herbipolensis]
MSAPTTDRVSLDQARHADVRGVLDHVIDPELDEPITDLGFVRSIDVSDEGAVEVHLRLPTSFCAPNFAYLMASDAKDAVVGLPWTTDVTVELDDHHDSDIINAGLAADAGYRGTFRHEADTDLEELRETFRRKAHTAAMERCLTGLLRADPTLAETDLGDVRLAGLPDDDTKQSLVRRRRAIGLGTAESDLVLVDPDGNGYAPDAVSHALRRARSTRISIDGNAHWCKGLLGTRYADEPADPTFVPLTALTVRGS